MKYGYYDNMRKRQALYASITSKQKHNKPDSLQLKGAEPFLLFNQPND